MKVISRQSGGCGRERDQETLSMMRSGTRSRGNMDDVDDGGTHEVIWTIWPGTRSRGNMDDVDDERDHEAISTM
jgi:hypothetical protein